jgi:uncharacterized membrane protein
MAHCTKCGAALADGAAFCPACGSAQAAVSNPVVSHSSTGPTDLGAAAAAPQMAENVAGTLCYVLGWITGLIFYFIDKRPYVRFHATQSIVTFGGLHILSFVIGIFFGVSLLSGGLGGFSMGYAFYSLIGLVELILWILLMIKAYQGERFRVPIAADLAEKLFGKA